MSDEPPAPPTELPSNVIETLDTASPGLLRDVADYAEELAEYRESEPTPSGEDGEDQVEEHPEELPDDVPSKATITTKEINDNRYYYWQWREGDKVKSKYKGPANSEEEVRS